ncbi:ABC transporter ATP-binding protein [Pseudoalteromonas sp. KG3]|uniref:ABC transporter ATP-binding protein n=1 Tax=Pseudoalteromonas prydzensis TaxID=182141 RepID=A0ABR9FL38_9GAMM|nr:MULTISPECIES: ABC transporter ATP-binding protein [Pseudoalteromonas]MBE0457553.1 ABC transporter ATP-binding protein [Pseudoalteromonas prydzensis]WKD26111.1 ABC transporter ATP-binding protein [Pseudoalteromonas sp. KG3]
MAALTPTMLELQQLSFGYSASTRLTVDGVSLQLKQGTCTAILGPNGAGKSTLISLMTGLLEPQAGHIEYPAYAQLSLKQAIAKKVALVPQDFAFYDELSVYDNLAFFVSISEKNRRLHRQYIESAIADCGLENVATKRASTLSGGYKRRLNIAIALSKQPDIIFLDEPTVGIDPLSRDAIIALLLDLKSQGKTLVYTSHLLYEVAQLCDDVLFLRNGKIVASQAINSAPLTLNFTTVSRLSEQHIALLAEQLTALGNNHYQLLINDTSDLSRVFTALGQLSHEIKSLNFSDNQVEQLYRALFTEPVC